MQVVFIGQGGSGGITSVNGDAGPAVELGVDAISALSATVNYGSGGSGELAALGADFSVVGVGAPGVYGSGFDRNYLCGTRNSAFGSGAGGGLGFGYLYGERYGVFLTGMDGAGVEFNVENLFNNIATLGVITQLQQKWGMFSVVKEGVTVTFRYNLGLVEGFTIDAGALTAGGEWTIGASNGGSIENGLDRGWAHGGAYVDRALSQTELHDLYQELVATGQLPDIAGGWTRGQRVEGDPGATWAPFSGAGNLTEAGAVDYEGVIYTPQWW